MAQQIINVGSAPNDGTGDVLRNSQIKANANFTELYANLGGVQSVVAGTNITVDNTDPLNPIVSASGGGGGGDSFLLYKKQWKSTGFTLNTWTNPGPSSTTFDNDGFGTYGTGTLPSDLHLYASWNAVPDGYIIDEIELEVRYKGSGGTASTLQVYIDISETNLSNNNDTISNTNVIVNETVSLGSGSILRKFVKKLTVGTNALPTLNKALIFISCRETTAGTNYGLAFNFKFKKV